MSGSRPTRSTSMRGEKGLVRAEAPRRRANERRGHGTFEADRPPVAGAVGRGSRRLMTRVIEHADAVTLEAFIEVATAEGATVYADERGAYNRPPESGRRH